VGFYEYRAKDLVSRIIHEGDNGRAETGGMLYLLSRNIPFFYVFVILELVDKKTPAGKEWGLWSGSLNKFQIGFAD
jgi:hypothetical protein